MAHPSPTRYHRHPGDWVCPCRPKDFMFASATNCRHCGQPKPGAQRGGTAGPGGGMRPGDWRCPGCCEIVFASKSACRKCGAARPGAQPAPAPSPQQQQQQQGPLQRQGDWLCPGCGDHQFARNAACRRCSTPRPGAAPQSPQPQQQQPQQQQPQQSHAPQPQQQQQGSPRRAGDWHCPRCGDHQFARNSECRKCRAPRPARPEGVPGGGCAGAAHADPAAAAGAPQPPARRPGDWDCPRCGDMQYARNTLCRRCHAPRPGTQPASAPAYPAEWTPQEGNLTLEQLAPTSPEYNAVAASLLATVPSATEIRVSRVQNRLLWKKYTAERQIMAEWNGAPPAELTLWHGTRGNHPKVVYNGQEGFDMRFCTSGMWGIASYFATRASYSHGYAHSEGNRKLLIFAQVLVGDTVELRSDSKLRMPPEKPAASAAAGGAEVHRFDSVQGVTGGTTVYMVYSNGRAYPKYLVEYTG